MSDSVVDDDEWHVDSVLTQFLAERCQLGRRGVTLLEVAALVLHEVREGDPAANPMDGDVRYLLELAVA